MLFFFICIATYTGRHVFKSYKEQYSVNKYTKAYHILPSEWRTLLTSIQHLILILALQNC